MCCLFGLIDYGNVFNASAKNKIIKILSTECEVRGTDATGIAFNTDTGLHIYKRPLAAHKIWYRIPEKVKVIMGHTRMTTQGSEKLNYNNHPFHGHIDGEDFALAHNGVLHNDIRLKTSEGLPDTPIQTDSYVAVQLIEKEKDLSFDSIRKMAEKTEGSFCYTILDRKNNLYFVKGDNPLAIYKFNGFYLYASTEEILTKAVMKLGFRNPVKISITCGDILKIDSLGITEVERFEFPEIYANYRYFYTSPYNYDYDSDYEALDILTEYAGYFGISQDDIIMLYDYGYSEWEIEEMLYSPMELQEFLSELRLMEMC